MAKKQTTTPDAAARNHHPPEPPPQTRSDPTQPDRVLLSVPLGDPRPGYVGRHLDVQLNHRQGLACKRALAGLAGRELSSGRRVASLPDVVRWILDQLAEGQPAEMS